MSTRIRWSQDGSQLFERNPETNTKTEWPSGSRDILDGDIYKTNWVDRNTTISPYQAMLSFPDTVVLDKINIKFSGNFATFKVWVSVDSTDGLDGNWVLKNTINYADKTYYSIPMSGCEAKWVRLHDYVGWEYHMYCIHVFGEYKNARYELWNTAQSEELSGDSILSFSDCPNSIDNHLVSSFKIKNMDTSSHNYTVQLLAVKYGGDTLVTNNIKLSTVNDPTKLSTISISNVPGSGFSEQINVNLDLTKANNLADGYHYYCIKVTEV